MKTYNRIDKKNQSKLSNGHETNPVLQIICKISANTVLACSLCNLCTPVVSCILLTKRENRAVCSSCLLYVCLIVDSMYCCLQETNIHRGRTGLWQLLPIFLVDSFNVWFYHHGVEVPIRSFAVFSSSN